MTTPSWSRRETVRPPRAHRGFTLLELMVALVLIGLVTSFAVLSLQGDSPAQTQRREAQRLLARMDLARDEAILQARSFGIRIEDNGYHFVEQIDGRWQPVDGPGLRPHALPAEMRFEVDVEGRDIVLDGEAAADEAEDAQAGDDGEDQRPQIFFLPGGEVMPPFTVRLISDATMTEFTVHPGAERWLALSREDL